jgi:hypothetical protein
MALVDDYIAAFRTQGHLDGLGEKLDPEQHFIAGVG